MEWLKDLSIASLITLFFILTLSVLNSKIHHFFDGEMSASNSFWARISGVTQSGCLRLNDTRIICLKHRVFIAADSNSDLLKLLTKIEGFNETSLVFNASCLDSFRKYCQMVLESLESKKVLVEVDQVSENVIYGDIKICNESQCKSIYEVHQINECIVDLESLKRGYLPPKLESCKIKRA